MQPEQTKHAGRDFRRFAFPAASAGRVARTFRSVPNATRFVGRREWPVPHAGGMSDISRWLSEARRATPPVYDYYETASRRDASHEKCERREPCWHPSGMRIIFRMGSGGVARQASLNHRLISCKPPACLRIPHAPRSRASVLPRFRAPPPAPRAAHPFFQP